MTVLKLENFAAKNEERNCRLQQTLSIDCISNGVRFSAPGGSYLEGRFNGGFFALPV